MNYDHPSNAQEALEAVRDLLEGTPAANIIDDIIEIIGNPPGHDDPPGIGNQRGLGNNNGNNGNHNGHHSEDDFEVTPVIMDLEGDDFNTIKETVINDTIEATEGLDTIQTSEGFDTIEAGEGFDVTDIQLLLDQGLSLTDIVENFVNPAEFQDSGASDAFAELLNALEQSPDEVAEVPVEQPEGGANANVVTIGIIGSAEASGTADNVQIIPGDQV